MRAFVISIAFVFAYGRCALAIASDPLNAPPPNLAPTSEHLATILTRHEEAVGKPAAGLFDTSIEDWRYTDSGMSGTEHVERSGSDYHSTITAGALTEEFGQYKGERWHRDYNGFVSPTTDIEQTTFFAERVNEDASDPKNDASVVGIAQGVHPAYVVKVSISGARRPEWIFYNARTFLITQVQWILRDDRGERRIVTTFSDFRTTGGMTSAWQVHDTWNPVQFSDDYVRTGMQVGVPVAASHFAQPPSSSRLPTYESIGFAIPAQVYDDGTIVLRMVVNGRGVDLMLDTASNVNILDEAIARDLALPTYGHVDRLPNGNDVPFFTTIPEATIGSAVYKNVVFDAMPYHFQQATYTKVVGVLGFDFLASNVFKVEYENGGKVSILPANTFDSADPVPDGIAYPLDLDDGIPFISLPMGSDVSKDVALANEFDHSVVFGSFLAAHTADVTNAKNGRHYQESLPFADNGSFGREVDIWRAVISRVSFGSVNFQGPTVIATNFPLRFSEDRPVDAFLGFDFLRWFDVYLDYPHNRIIVKPNDLLRKMVHHT